MILLHLREKFGNETQNKTDSFSVKALLAISNGMDIANEEKRGKNVSDNHPRTQEAGRTL